MKRVLPLLLLVVPQLAQSQWVEVQKGELVIRGGWLFDSVSDERRPNSGIVFLANGVTSTWSAGEYYPERVIAQRDRIDAGESIGPRLFASGPYFGAFRCEYNIKTAADECIGWPNDITEDEIRQEVDTWAEQGVVSIKIKQATPGEMKILIGQAHKRGMTTAAHLSNYNVEYDVDSRDAILCGQPKARSARWGRMIMLDGSWRSAHCVETR